MTDNRKYASIENIVKSVSNGSIVKKNIQGKPYYYFQYYKNGKTKSVYIPKKYLEDIEELLKRKADSFNREKELLKNTRNLPSLSANSKELTGQLMMEDKVVARFEKGQLIDIDEKLCPLLIKRTHNLQLFLASRAIDSGRTNARLLKKALNIKESEDYLISQYSYGATITDNYWFKPLFSKLKYGDISFNNDFYGELALNGSFNVLPKYSKHTPQLTLIGSFEKCWKKENGEWWLYKKGSRDNNLSELLAYELSEKLGIETAIYKAINEETIKTRNFASKYNFEPMSAIAGDDDSYSNVYAALSPYGKKIKQAYLKIIYLDTIVFNVDRHNENCGLLRDRISGKVVALAPNFDNNLSLLASGKNIRTNRLKDSLIKMFVDFLKENREAYLLFKEIQFNELNKGILESIDILNKMGDKKEEVIDFILSRYDYLKEKLT